MPIKPDNQYRSLVNWIPKNKLQCNLIIEYNNFYSKELSSTNYRPLFFFQMNGCPSLAYTISTVDMTTPVGRHTTDMRNMGACKHGCVLLRVCSTRILSLSRHGGWFYDNVRVPASYRRGSTCMSQSLPESPSLLSSDIWPGKKSLPATLKPRWWKLHVLSKHNRQRVVGAEKVKFLSKWTHGKTTIKLNQTTYP